jgi:uncharacterized protein (DUF488 family)
VPTVFTVGHGTRPLEELIACLTRAGRATLVDIRRFPGSARRPQFNQGTLARALAGSGIRYRHAVELGGRHHGEPGEERFSCIRNGAFRAYAARMGTPQWQESLASVLADEAPCLMCAETLWWRCHRRLVADLLTARGVEVVHLLAPGRSQGHRLMPGGEVRDGRLFLCGALVA